jgi:hypothetical protein
VKKLGILMSSKQGLASLLWLKIMVVSETQFKATVNLSGAIRT